MTEKEFINLYSDTEINKEIVDSISKMYGCELPIDIQKILSVELEDAFVGSWRILSSDEVIMQKEWMNRDFVKNGIIPLIDVQDLDYISYILSENIWAIVNDGDGVIFSRKNELVDYLE